MFSPIYDRIKNVELSRAFWNFNVFVETLTDSGETPVEKKWTKAYLEPSNLLRLISVVDNGGHVIRDYEFRTGRIYANETTLFAKFQRKIDEADFPPYFEAVMVARLMAEAGLAMIGDSDSIARLWDNYFRTIRDSRRIDAQQNKPRTLIGNNSPWLQSHSGSPFFGNLTVL